MNMPVELRRNLLRCCVVLAALFAQVAVVPALAVFGVQPSILLVAFVMFAFRAGALPAIWLGFACGTILDAYSSTTAGAFALAMTLVGFAVGQLEERKIHVGYAMRVSVLGIAVVLHDSVWHLASHHGVRNLPIFLLRVSLPGALYTMFAGAILFAVRPPRTQVRTW
jgi:rod shape-determining protein MreD